MSETEPVRAASARPEVVKRADRAATSSHQRVLRLALPAVGEQTLNMTVGLANTFMVGHLGAASLAAVGLSNQLVMLVTTILAAVAIGSTALVARCIGAGDQRMANQTVQQSFLIGSIVGVSSAVIFFLGAEASLRMLGATGESLAQGVVYMRIVSPSILFSALLFVCTACLRGAGDTRTPLWIMGLVNIVNIILAAALIYGFFGLPKLGVAGSAWGATVGRSLGGLAVIVVLVRGRGILRLSRLRVLPDSKVIRRILRVGLPSGVESFLMRGGMLGFARVVASLGMAEYAAHTVALNVESLSYLPGFGFAVAGTTLVGQGLGAKDPVRAEQDGYMAYRWGGLLMGLMGVVFIFGAHPLMAVFTSDPEVIALGTGPLRLVGLAQPFLAAVMIFAGALRGAGDTRWPLVINGISIWVVRLSLAFIFVTIFRWGLVGAWLAMVIDFSVRGTLIFLRFRSGGWKMARV